MADRYSLRINDSLVRDRSTMTLAIDFHDDTFIDLFEGISSCGFVADSFDIVSVRADDEGAIVVGVVLRTQARRAIVFPTCFERSTVERID